MSTFDTKIPPPTPRSYRARLTAELKKMKPGQSKAVDARVAACLAAFIRRNGGSPLTRAEGDLVRVWWPA